MYLPHTFQRLEGTCLAETVTEYPVHDLPASNCPVVDLDFEHVLLPKKA